MNLSYKPKPGPGRARVLAAALALMAGGCGQLLQARAPTPPPELAQADAAFKAGDRQRAISLLDAAIKKDPANPVLYTFVIHECGLTGHTDLIGVYLNRGVAAIPRDHPLDRAQLYLAAGAEYDELHEYAASVTANETAFQLAPDSPLTMNGLGYAYAESGTNLDRAIELTNKAISTARDAGADDKELGMYEDSLGWAYYKKRDYAPALTALADAAELTTGQPGHDTILLHLGLTYHALGKDEQARIALLRARAIIGQNAPAAQVEPVVQALAEVESALAARKAQPPAANPPPKAGQVPSPPADSASR